MSKLLNFDEIFEKSEFLTFESKNVISTNIFRRV